MFIVKMEPLDTFRFSYGQLQKWDKVISTYVSETTIDKTYTIIQPILDNLLFFRITVPLSQGIQRELECL